MVLQDIIDTSPLADSKQEDLSAYEIWFRDTSGEEIEVTSAKFIYDSVGTKYIVLS